MSKIDFYLEKKIVVTYFNKYFEINYLRETSFILSTNRKSDGSYKYSEQGQYDNTMLATRHFEVSPCANTCNLTCHLDGKHIFNGLHATLTFDNTYLQEKNGQDMGVVYCPRRYEH